MNSSVQLKPAFALRATRLVDQPSDTSSFIRLAKQGVAGPKQMAFPSCLSNEERDRYLRAVTEALHIQTHLDLFLWLQGDVQRYLPHDMLVTAWGDFDQGLLQYDIVSPMPGVRTVHANPTSLTPLLSDLFKRWIEVKKRPYAVTTGEAGFTLGCTQVNHPIRDAFQSMRVALVHGITDHRGRHDCLYVVLSRNPESAIAARSSIRTVLPHIDTALRQVAHMPSQQVCTSTKLSPLNPTATQPFDTGLSEREQEIMSWVEQGKTNGEIGTILDISTFTVKNHLQRIFKKLNVYNRAQAVSRFKDSNLNG